MYFLKTESRFDSAHFLLDYDGKCRNIHGHEWRVIIEIASESLDDDGQTRDMVCDFGTLKKDLKEETEAFDHALLVEEGSLKESTLSAMTEEGFKIIRLPFRPTSERLAFYFYQKMRDRGYDVFRATVYETAENSASYSREMPGL